MQKKYRGYLIDLDGTIYYGRKRIPSAEKFVNHLMTADIPFQIITNNATRTSEQIAHTLKMDHEVLVPPENIYTSTSALLDYLLKFHSGDDLYVIGENALRMQLEESGFKINQTSTAKVVVQGLDREVTYNKLGIAVQAILNGAAFIVTNNDHLLPTENGLMPSSGAITAFINYSTKVDPIIMGKPHTPIIEGALSRMNESKDEILLIGDNYQTDILAGIHNGLDTLLVLTGVTSREDLVNIKNQPTYILNNLTEWVL